MTSPPTAPRTTTGAPPRSESYAELKARLAGMRPSIETNQWAVTMNDRELARGRRGRRMRYRARFATTVMTRRRALATLARLRAEAARTDPNAPSRRLLVDEARRAAVAILVALDRPTGGPTTPLTVVRCTLVRAVQTAAPPVLPAPIMIHCGRRA